MKRLICLILCTPLLVLSQITVISPTNNTELVGKIKISNTDPISFKPPKNLISDGLQSNNNNNAHFELRKETNNTYSNLKTYSTIFGELSSSMVYFKDKNMFLFTFLNRAYDYRNESVWISKQTKEDLYLLLKSELKKKEKYKNIELIIDNKITLVIAMHNKKASFNLWDGYNWYSSNWYRIKKLNNLFGK